MSKIIKLIILVGLVVSVFLIYYYYLNLPECYLVELEDNCQIGYYSHGLWHQMFTNLKLRECCKGTDYIMKGVYGDKTSWWIFGIGNFSGIDSDTYDSVCEWCD